MFTREDFEKALEEVADELPDELYEQLNGGVMICDDALEHEKSVSDDLYVLGAYHCDREMGRYIEIYYGSFVKMFPYYTPEQLKDRLRKTLRHEFRHHLESLGGEFSLELEDAAEIDTYLQAHEKKDK